MRFEIIKRQGGYFPLTIGLLSLALAGISHGTTEPAANSPQRVAVMALDVKDGGASGNGIHRSLKGFLLDRLQREARVRLLDPCRVDSILGLLSSPAYDVDGAFLFRHLAAFVPADALICLLPGTNGNICVSVVNGSGIAQESYGCADAAAAPAATFAKATAFALSALKLSLGEGDGVQSSIDVPADPTLYVNYFRCLGIPPYGEPTREPRLWPIASTEERAVAAVSDALNNLLWQWRTNSTLFAARKLYNLGIAGAGSDGVEKFAADNIDALAVVLGTGMEAAAYPALSRPGGKRFEPFLQKCVLPLLPIKADSPIAEDLFKEIVDESAAELPRLENGDTAVPGKARSKPAERTAALGALRCLGFIQIPSALKALLGAASSGDQQVREAAAFGLGRQTNDLARAALKKMTRDPQKSVALAAMLGLAQQGSFEPDLLPVLRKAADTLFETSVPACNAFAACATAEDKNQLRSLSDKLNGAGRAAVIKGRLRMGDIGPEAMALLLRDEDAEVILATLARLQKSKAPPEALPALRVLANDPDRTIAATAYAVLAATNPGGSGDPLFRLECGSQYERLSVLEGETAKREIVPPIELLEKAMGNFLPLIRLEALRLLDEHYPDRIAGSVKTALSDRNRWVRMQAAAMAAGKSLPELAEELRNVLAREPANGIKLALQTALAKATGKPLPPVRPSAVPMLDSPRRIWSNVLTDKHLDYMPVDGVLAYVNYLQPHAAINRARGKPIFARALWGAAPGGDSLIQSPRTLDDLWGSFDEDLPEESQLLLDGCDLRIFGLGGDWTASWRDFCRDAGIDSVRVDGDYGRLNVYEKRAFEYWKLERGISGYNLLRDLTRLKHRFTRPGLQLSAWSHIHLAFKPEVAASLGRWKFDLGWSVAVGPERAWTKYPHARMCRTVWPDRPFVYDAPEPGGIPDEWIHFNSPMPSTFIFESTNRLYAHTLLAWLGGAHMKIVAGWRFLDYKTKPEGLYTPSVRVSFVDAGPDPAALDAGIAHAFKDISAVAMGKPGEDSDLPGGDADISIDLEGEKRDAHAPAKKAMRIGILLAQKHIYDCARIFGSLPRFDPEPDTLLLQYGVEPASSAAPAGVPPVNAGRELAGHYDLLPSINLVVDRDLSTYRLIIVHNGTLLRDETIEKLSRWLKETPGLLLIHQNLTADNTAEASTPADHDGILRRDWPWEKDLVIHPAYQTDPSDQTDQPRRIRLADLELACGAGKVKVTADTAVSHAVCLTSKAEALARVGDKAVLARWRDPGYRGAVLFDGLRNPSKEYLELLANEINSLAAQGIGRRISGRPAMLEAETEQFQAVVSPGYGDMIKTSCRLTGIDLMSGVIDPTVGPGGVGAAIVPRKDYFHRYLACTPRIVALGDREFTQASEADGGGLKLHNAGLIQLAGRSPLKVQRQNGGLLPAISFDYNWIFDGKKEGVTTFTSAIGGQLTFVRCRDPIVVLEAQ